MKPIFSPSASSYRDHLFYARRPHIAAAAEPMPRPNPPPTPGSSSDIRGKEGAFAPPTFNLPPTAYQEQDQASRSSATPSANGSDSSYRPASPTSPGQSRKRPASQQGAVVTKDDFTLPPPPTRSRKIIQMKPRENEPTSQLDESTTTSAAGGRAQATTQAGGKRKQNVSGTTAAGRKIARKTAHSLIERRRRSKMNEEFGVLKDMIPACQGQEMHKLAILQASIEYLRYLEQCVSDLKAQNLPSKQPAPPTYAPRDQHQDVDNDHDDDDDEEMDDDEEAETSTPVTRSQDPSAATISLPPLSQITTATTSSPSIFSAGEGRHYSISSTSQASYSPYFHSNQTSPAFGPQLSHGPSFPASAGPFGLGSPALKALDSKQDATDSLESQRPGSKKARKSEHELDQEATAALLMLNHVRRSWRAAQQGEASRSSTGMSVRDLLSG